MHRIAAMSRPLASTDAAERPSSAEMVAIDAGVEMPEALAACLPAGVRVEAMPRGATPATLVRLAALWRGEVGVLHLFAHGAPGELHLDGGVLTLETLDAHRDDLAALGRALGPDGALLVYGCRVGAGERGRAFVAALAEVTGLAVAASDMPVGDAGRGGAWRLGVRAGGTGTHALDLPAYPGLLPTQYVFQATNASGQELWITDGTAAGTSMVRDINPGTGSSGANDFFAFNNRVFFLATDGSSGTELWVTDGTSAGTSMLKDINPGTDSSVPTEFASVNGKLLFRANDGSAGNELWVSDGTSAGTSMLMDIYAGDFNGNPQELVTVGSKVLFVAGNAAAGRELWITDGTAAGTSMIMDINATTADSSISGLTVVGSKVYFSARTAAAGLELWVTDGTSAGTSLVLDINSGTGHSVPSDFAAYGSKVLFAATGSASAGEELWISDGTSAGTSLLRNLNTGSSLGSSPSNITLLAGSTAVFSATGNGSGNTELWVTNGTSSGTSVIEEIRAGTSLGSFPSKLTLFGSRALFQADNGSNGTELWITDGTSTGTVLVRDILSGSGGSSPSELMVLGSQALFQANDGSKGTELWITDGTSAGTSLLVDISSGSASSSPKSFTAVTVPTPTVTVSPFSSVSPTAGGSVDFMATFSGAVDDPNSVDAADFQIVAGTGVTTDAGITVSDNGDDDPATFKVTVSNVVGQGTLGLNFVDNDSISVDGVLVGKGGVGNGNATGSTLTVNTLLNRVVFSANDGSSGTELWVTDGTTSGTSLLSDIRTGTAGSFPTQFAPLGSKVLFQGNDGSTGTELWVTDGTASGTSLLVDLASGAGQGSPVYFTPFDDKLLFAAFGSSGTELWVTDGTASGTSVVRDINPGTGSSSPQFFTALGDKVVFSATDGSTGTELWITDGTSSGTFLLRDIKSGSAHSTPQDFVELGSKMLFRADDGSKGMELWVTDGTTTGTSLLVDIRNGSTGSTPASLTLLGDKVLFAASDGSLGSELWVSDGTASGTSLLRDLWVGSSPGSPTFFTPLGNKVLFSATNGNSSNGTELWVTDGTSSGTSMLRDIMSGSFSSSPNQFAVLGNKVIFTANDGITGTELWISDGTSSGTSLLLDINSGTGSGNPNGIVVLGSKAYFQANSGSTGAELWVTDGTESGTSLVRDINAGSSASSPTHMTAVYLKAAAFATVSVTAQTATPTNAGTVDFLATFSGAPDDASQVTAADFEAVAGTGVTTGTISITDNGDVDAKTFKVSVAGVTGNGTLALKFKDDDSVVVGGTAVGGAGTGNGDATSAAVTIDQTAPTNTVATAAFSADTGSSSTDFLTNSASQTVSGTLAANLAAGESVRVSLDNGATWNTATATVGQTAWSLGGVTLAGSNTLKVKVSDTAGNDGTVYSQAYVLDTALPTLNGAGSDPADGATGVAAGVDLVIDFSEDVVFGSSGTIYLRNVTTDAVVETFSVSGGTATASGGGTATLSGDKLTLNPGADLRSGTEYAVTLDVNALRDAAGNGIDAVGDYTTYNLTTAAGTVTLSAGSTSLAEDGGSTTITATLSRAASTDTTVTVAASGTATGGGTDYTLSSTTITIAAGNTTGTATLTAVRDTAGEGAETVVLAVTAVSGGGGATESGDQQQTVTITDDDIPSLTLALGAGQGAKSNGGTATFNATFGPADLDGSGTGLTAADFTIEKTGTVGTDPTVSLNKIDGKTYTVSVTGITGEGTVGIKFVDDDTVKIGGVSIGGTGADNGTVAGPTVTIDTTAPTLALDTISGDNRVNGTEDESSLTVSGTTNAEDGQTVTVVLGVGPTAVTSTSTVTGGTWTTTFTSADVKAQPEGALPVKANVTDQAGNGAPQASRNLVYNRSASVPTPSLASDTGASSSDFITSDTQVNVTGLETDATWEYSTDNGGSWSAGTGTSFTVSAGTYAANHIQVRQTDVVGNLSDAGKIASTVVIDTSALAPGLALANDTGSSGTDGITTLGTLVVSSLETGASWEYSTNGGTSWTGGSGSTFDLAQGSYAADQVQVRQKDAAHNVSTAAKLAATVVDETAPAINTGTSTLTVSQLAATTGTVVGTITATDTLSPGVTFAFDTGTAGGGDADDRFDLNAATGQVTVRAGATFDKGTDPTHDIYVKATDTAGNVTGSTKLTVSVTANNAAPALGNLSGSTAYTEQAAGVAIDGDLTVTDAESSAAGTLTGATARFERQGGANAQDGFGHSGTLSALTEGQSFSVGGTAIGTVTTNSGGVLLLTFNSAATMALAQEALRAVTYANSSDNPPSTVTLDITFNDNNATGIAGTAQSATATKSIAITAVNDAPVLATAIGNQSGEAGSAFSYVVPAGTFTDPEGQTLTYAVTGLPAGLAFNAGTRTISGTPTSGGTSTVSVTASDGSLTGTATTFQLTVSDPAPPPQPPPPPPPPPGPVIVIPPQTTPPMLPPVPDPAKVIEAPPPVTVTLPAAVTEDGAQVQRGTGADPNRGGQTVEQVVIAPVSTTRQEQTGTPTANADIRIGGDSQAPTIVATLPTGVGMQVVGTPTTLTLGQLAGAAQAETAMVSKGQANVEGTVATTGLSTVLPSDTPVTLRTITPTLAAGQTTAPSQPIVISVPTSTPGTANTVEAVVVDARSLPSGTVIELRDVDYAVITGSLFVTGGTGSNVAIGDDAQQYMRLGADDDTLFGGGGNDTVGSVEGDDMIHGDAGDDSVFGGDNHDRLDGGTGNDTIDGGTGLDHVRYAGNRADYIVSTAAGVTTVQHRNGGADGTDTITTVERLRFADGDLVPDARA
ncbi:MAG TPA: ELWxxDGT repeat protein, partial [Azospirillaceae bacterium]|nr:ELWxxDGT repeat protein [Azospirillaceae bacterium]